MARSLSSPSLSVALSTTLKNSLSGLGRTVSVPVGLSYTPNLASGTDASQVDRSFEYYDTLTDGNSLVIDLATWSGIDIGAGDGNDGTGQALAPLHQIVALAIVNEGVVDAAGLLEVEPDVTDGWTPLGSHTVALGGALSGQGALVKTNLGTDAFIIDSGSSSRIKLTATGGDVTFRIMIYARSVAAPSSSSSSSSSGV